MSAPFSIKNKLTVSWSDSSFFPWINEATVLDYFCDVRNTFYSVECNNELLKMQGINPDQLSSMIGYEYQLHISKPPLYVIRKVQRTSQREVIPLSFYYVLNGVVYQAPDLMSVLSSRLQTTSHYLEECLDTAFSHYKYNPSRGYYWDFSKKDETKQSGEQLSQQKVTQFQRERVELLLQEFTKEYPPYVNQEQDQQALVTGNETAAVATTTTTTNGTDTIADTTTNIKLEQPVEKRMKMANNSN